MQFTNIIGIDSCEHRKYKMQNTLYSAVLCGRTCFYSHSYFCPIPHESTRARSPSSSLYSNTNYTILFFFYYYIIVITISYFTIYSLSERVLSIQ